jgi:membrane protein required for colicin V production
MNWLDFVLLFIVLVGALFGFFQRLVRQIGGLVSLYIGLVLASAFYGHLTNWLGSHFRIMSREVGEVLSFLVIFALVYGLLELIFRRTVPESRLAFLGVMDQLGGVILGFLATAAQVGVALLILQFVGGITWVRGDSFRLAFLQAFDSSLLAPLFTSYVSLVVGLVQPWLPGGLPSFFVR